jgi:hypothetical protein
MNDIVDFIIKRFAQKGKDLYTVLKPSFYAHWDNGIFHPIFSQLTFEAVLVFPFGLNWPDNLARSWRFSYQLADYSAA